MWLLRVVRLVAEWTGKSPDSDDDVITAAQELIPRADRDDRVSVYLVSTEADGRTAALIHSCTSPVGRPHPGKVSYAMLPEACFLERQIAPARVDEGSSSFLRERHFELPLLTLESACSVVRAAWGHELYRPVEIPKRDVKQELRRLCAIHSDLYRLMPPDWQSWVGRPAIDP